MTATPHRIGGCGKLGELRYLQLQIVFRLLGMRLRAVSCSTDHGMNFSILDVCVEILPLSSNTELALVTVHCVCTIFTDE